LPFTRRHLDSSRPPFLLGNRNDSAFDLEPGEFAQRAPAIFARDLPQLTRADFRPNQIGNFLIWQEEFVDRYAAAITFVVALDTTLAAPRLNLALIHMH